MEILQTIILIFSATVNLFCGIIFFNLAREIGRKEKKNGK